MVQKYFLIIIGGVSFEELLMKMYPALEKDHMLIIHHWIK